MQYFTTTLRNDNLTIYGTHDGDTDAEFELTINWGVVINFRENGIVEPPTIVLRSLELIKKSFETVTNHYTHISSGQDESFLEELDDVKIDIEDFNIEFNEDVMLESMHKSGLQILDARIDLDQQTIEFLL